MLLKILNNASLLMSSSSSSTNPISIMSTPTLPFLRTAFNYSMSQASLDSGLTCEDPSLAQQNTRDECDINVIMERFGRGMALPENFRAPSYADFVGVSDFHTAMNAVAQAGEAFDSMPASLRARFNNNPQNLLEFLSSDDNRSEAVKLGLLHPPPEAAPVIVALPPSAAPTTPSTPKGV